MEQMNLTNRTKDELSVGVNVIVAKHLERQLGFKVTNTKTLVTDHMLFTKAQDLPTPPEAKRFSRGNQFWFQQYYDAKLKASEDILKERIELLVNQPVRMIHYIVGLKGEEIDVVIFLSEGQYHVA